MMSKKIRVIHLDSVNRHIHELMIDNTLSALQELVGGYIERVPGSSNECSIWCDEEGLIKGLEYGFLWPSYPNPIAGNGVITGVSKNGDTKSVGIKLEDVDVMFWVADKENK